MKLVADWKQGWRWFSTQCMALSVAALSAWDSIPDDWKAMFPADDIKPIVVWVLVFGVLGRFVDQGDKAE